jgi:hypothetical protein
MPASSRLLITFCFLRLSATSTAICSIHIRILNILTISVTVPLRRFRNRHLQPAVRIQIDHTVRLPFPKSNCVLTTKSYLRETPFLLITFLENVHWVTKKKEQEGTDWSVKFSLKDSRRWRDKSSKMQGKKFFHFRLTSFCQLKHISCERISIRLKFWYFSTFEFIFRILSTSHVLCSIFDKSIRDAQEMERKLKMSKKDKQWNLTPNSSSTPQHVFTPKSTSLSHCYSKPESIFQGICLNIKWSFLVRWSMRETEMKRSVKLISFEKFITLSSWKHLL